MARVRVGRALWTLAIFSQPRSREVRQFREKREIFRALALAVRAASRSPSSDGRKGWVLLRAHTYMTSNIFWIPCRLLPPRQCGWREKQAKCLLPFLNSPSRGMRTGRSHIRGNEETRMKMNMATAAALALSVPMSASAQGIPGLSMGAQPAKTRPCARELVTHSARREVAWTALSLHRARRRSRSRTQPDAHAAR